MDTSTLKRILYDSMSTYTGEGLNDIAWLTVNEAAQVYAVIAMAQIQGQQVVGAVLVARIEENRIMIDLDLHDKLLIDMLRAQGVPEAQIIQAAGEAIRAAS